MNKKLEDLASIFNKSDLSVKVKGYDSFFMPIKKIEKTTAIEDGIEKQIEKEVETEETPYLQTLDKIDEIANVIINGGFNEKTRRFMDCQEITKNINDFTNKRFSDYGVGGTGYLTQTIITRAVDLIKQEEPIFQLFSEKIAFKTNTQLISPKFVDTTNGSLDIGPNNEYHKVSVDEDFEMVTTTGASGIDVLLSETTIKNSSWDVLKIFLSAGKNSLIRWKDTKAVRVLFNEATVCFDNLGSPLAGDDSVFGHTTGVGIDTKKYNNAFTMDDFWLMFRKAITDGFLPNMILTSVEGYGAFMDDPTIKEFIKEQTGVLFKLPTNITAGTADVVSAMNGSYNKTQKLGFDIPGGMFSPSKAFMFIVTPYIPSYKAGDVIFKSLLDSKNDKVPYLDGAGDKVICGTVPVTSLVLLDSKNALYYCEEEKLRTLNKIDEFDETTKIRLKEKYSFVKKHNKRGVYVAKNIFLAKDTVDLNRNITVDLATVAEIKANL